MKREWLRKLRGLFGLGALGGVVGALFGVIWTLGSALISGELTAAALAWGTGQWAGLGAFTSVGLGSALMLTSKGRQVADLSVWKAGVVGGLFGAAAPSLLFLALTGSLAAQGLVPVVAVGAVVGAGLAGGLVRIAKLDSGARVDEGEGAEGLSSGERRQVGGDVDGT